MQRSATVSVIVAAASTTTTSTSTTTTTIVGGGQFGIGVVADGRRLRTGGAVSFEVTVVPATGFSGTVLLNVSGVPALVSAAFTVNPTSSRSVLWLSTTLNPPPGTYPMLLVAIGGTTVQSIPLTLVIE